MALKPRHHMMWFISLMTVLVTKQLGGIVMKHDHTATVSWYKYSITNLLKLLAVLFILSINSYFLNLHIYY